MRPQRDPGGAALGFAVAAGLTAFGVWQYFVLAEWEQTGGSRRMHALERLLYDVGGKYAVVAMFLAVAGVAFHLGLERYRGAGRT